MSTLAFVTAILNALIAIPKIGDMVSSIVDAIVTWWASRQTGETLVAIADAAALSARAQTDADRYAAAEAWQKALSRPRVSP